MKQTLLAWGFKPDKNPYTFKRGTTKIVVWKNVDFATVHFKKLKQTFYSKESLVDFLLKNFKFPQP
jgi:hypothetical protein